MKGYLERGIQTPMARGRSTSSSGFGPEGRQHGILFLKPPAPHPFWCGVWLVTGPRRCLSLTLSDTRFYAPQIRARLYPYLGRSATKSQVLNSEALTRRGDASRAGWGRLHRLWGCLWHFDQGEAGQERLLYPKLEARNPKPETRNPIS
jgi:hypothetical protein